jgi:hypothetical protein
MLKGKEKDRRPGREQRNVRKDIAYALPCSTDLDQVGGETKSDFVR